MPNPSGSSCVGIKPTLQAHLVLEESVPWLDGRFRVYWRFGKPNDGVSLCAPMAGPAPGSTQLAGEGAANDAPQCGCTKHTRFGVIAMAQVCDICGKGPQFGNNISHAHNVTRRRWNVNLQAVKALVNGSAKRIRVCTSCIKSGKIAKA